MYHDVRISGNFYVISSEGVLKLDAPTKVGEVLFLIIFLRTLLEWRAFLINLLSFIARFSGWFEDKYKCEEHFLLEMTKLLPKTGRCKKSLKMREDAWLPNFDRRLNLSWSDRNIILKNHRTITENHALGLVYIYLQTAREKSRQKWEKRYGNSATRRVSKYIIFKSPPKIHNHDRKVTNVHALDRL